MKATGNSSSKFWAAGALAALMALASPAFAQHSGGGHGGGGGGGGAHFSGGGGHVGGGGFGGRPGGFSGGHAALGGGGFAGGARYAPRVGYSGFRGGYVGGHVASAAAYRGGYAGGRVGFAGRPNAFVGRAGYAGHPGYGYGYGRGGFGWSRPYWGGGYFHGGYWPRAYYGWSYPWFLGVLPGVYATYWWGGIPYYYANDVYYTWNGGYNGYVATDPPPAADSESSGAADGDYAAAEPGSNADAGGSPGNAGYNSNNTDVYAYPKDGQSDEQQSTDRYECHKWAVAQSGFDPTHPSTMAGNRADYRRAMTACLDGRGYSAK